MTPVRDAGSGRGVNRRQLLIGGAVAGLGAAAAIGADLALTAQDRASSTPTTGTEAVTGGETIAFHGPHQAGIAAVPQAHATFIALDLRPSTSRDGLRRMMRILTDDAARLTQGEAALADSEAELAAAPARLTVTFGFGPGLVARAGGDAPEWLAPLPAFSIDRLEDAWSGGDLLIDIASDDPLTVAHTARMLLKDARRFATVRWRQDGFRRARGTEQPGTTMRNLFGQVDGTVNPTPGTHDFDAVVWATDGWVAGGTSLVIRRIRMTLDTWDELDRSGREQSIGRTLSNGAPLTGTKETDEPDFTATGTAGFPVIPDFAHIRRARGDGTERIYRRSYNYDLPPTGDGVSESGLIFASYQSDVIAQFLPIQRRLDELDLLNQWTIPIGSAVFAIPPGCDRDGFIGETLLA
ncbi:MAG: Dyp-type peroxidase [Microbacteriaceae bacterium]|nr:MAG: Dyp-type peroxidase [Microbacteriaceae bacterium]